MVGCLSPLLLPLDLLIVLMLIFEVLRVAVKGLREERKRGIKGEDFVCLRAHAGSQIEGSSVSSETKTTYSLTRLYFSDSCCPFLNSATSDGRGIPYNSISAQSDIMVPGPPTNSLQRLWLDSAGYDNILSYLVVKIASTSRLACLKKFGPAIQPLEVEAVT